MIKTMHRNWEEYPELMQREIDLACGLRDKKASILTLLVFFVVSHCIEIFLSYMSSIYLFTDSGMMQLIHHNAMWCNGHKFRIKKLDDKRKTFDFGITAVFKSLMFPLEVIGINKYLKISTMVIWKI